MNQKMKEKLSSKMPWFRIMKRKSRRRKKKKTKWDFSVQAKTTLPKLSSRNLFKKLWMGLVQR